MFCIETINISKIYKNNIKPALDNINLNIASGDFVSIMGASGSGKTTLLNCLGTIDTVDNGVIIINGQDISK